MPQFTSFVGMDRRSKRLPGIGSSPHLISKLLLLAARNLTVTLVTSRGSGRLIQDLISATIATPKHLSFVDAGMISVSMPCPLTEQALAGFSITLFKSSPT